MHTHTHTGAHIRRDKIASFRFNIQVIISNKPANRLLETTSLQMKERKMCFVHEKGIAMNL